MFLKMYRPKDFSIKGGFFFLVQFFWMVTDTYREGTVKEMKKWAYEIYSTFLDERAVCRV